MAKEQDLDLGPEFDDSKCVEFILNLIPEQDREGITEDDIQYVLDVIYDFYESEGLLDENVASDGYVDETAELEFIRRAAKRDGINLNDEQIQLILDGEFEYGKQSLVILLGCRFDSFFRVVFCGSFLICDVELFNDDNRYGSFFH